MPKVWTKGIVRLVDVKYAEHLQKRIDLIRFKLWDKLDIASGEEREKVLRRLKRLRDIQVRLDVSTLDYLE